MAGRERDRNQKGIGITWQFTRKKVREKFKIKTENMGWGTSALTCGAPAIGWSHTTAGF
jgi:hypothetical protein